MNFKKVYEKVKWIVWKCEREYYIHLWEHSDWEQEGMLVLYELQLSQEGIETNDEKLFCYFKTKFRNHILDIIRKQESQKRKFDKQPYEEVSEIGHKLKSKEMFLDELVAFRDAITTFKNALNEENLEKYHRLLANERFKGRKEMIRTLQKSLADFSEDSII